MSLSTNLSLVYRLPSYNHSLLLSRRKIALLGTSSMLNRRSADAGFAEGFRVLPRQFSCCVGYLENRPGYSVEGHALSKTTPKKFYSVSRMMMAVDKPSDEVAKNTTGPYPQHAADAMKENTKHIQKDDIESGIYTEGTLGESLNYMQYVVKPGGKDEGGKEELEKGKESSGKTVSDYVSNLSYSARDKVSQSAQSVQEKAGGYGQDAKRTIEKGVNQTEESVENAYGRMKESLAENASSLTDKVKQQASDTAAVGKDKTNQILEQAEGAISGAEETVQAKAGEYIGRAKDSAHQTYEHSKDAVKNQASQVGERVQGMTTEASKEVRDVAESTLQHAKSTLHEYVDYAKERAAAVGHELHDAAGRDVQRAKHALHEFSQHPKESITEGVQYIQGATHDIQDAFKEAAHQIQDKTKAWTEAGRDKAENVGKGVKNTPNNMSQEIKQVSEDIGRHVVADFKLNDVVQNVGESLKSTFKQEQDAFRPEHPREYTQQVKESLYDSGKEAHENVVRSSEKMQEKADAMTRPVKEAFEKGYEEGKAAVESGGTSAEGSLRDFGDHLSKNIKPPGSVGTDEDEETKKKE